MEVMGESADSAPRPAPMRSSVSSMPANFPVFCAPVSFFGRLLIPAWIQRRVNPRAIMAQSISSWYRRGAALMMTSAQSEPRMTSLLVLRAGGSSWRHWRPDAPYSSLAVRVCALAVLATRRVVPRELHGIVISQKCMKNSRAARRGMWLVPRSHLVVRAQRLDHGIDRVFGEHKITVMAALPPPWLGSRCGARPAVPAASLHSAFVPGRAGQRD